MRVCEEMGHASRMCWCACAIAAFDAIIVGRGWNHSSSTRWFLLHFATNMVIAVLTVPGVRHMLTHPHDALTVVDDEDRWTSPTSKWPLTLIVTLHLYHCVARFKLTSDDWFHHILFVPTLGIPGMIYEWGSLANWFAFFMCGIPGGVDYLLLGLQKMGRCQHVNQKRISANLNVWLRMPGILFAIGIAYSLRMQGRCRAPTVPFYVQVAFMPFNALYYAKYSVINYTLHRVRRYVPTQSWSEVKKIT